MTKDKKQRYTFYCDWPGCPGVHESENSRCDAPVPAPAEPVAGETKYTPLDTKACFNTAAHFEHSWDYRNKTFRCLGKSICISVAVPEGEAKRCSQCNVELCGEQVMANIQCNDVKGHSGQHNFGTPPMRIPDCRHGHSLLTSIPDVTPPTNPSTDKWRVGRTLGRTLYIGDRFIGSVDTPELASQIVEAVNGGGVSTAGMTALTFSDFQAHNIDRASHAFPPQCLTPEFLAIGIAGEAGEMCNLVKKVLRGDFSLESQRQDILKEIADIVTYCDLFMSVLKADTAHELIGKFNEVSERRGWKSPFAPPTS